MQGITLFDTCGRDSRCSGLHQLQCRPLTSVNHANLHERFMDKLNRPRRHDRHIRITDWCQLSLCNGLAVLKQARHFISCCQFEKILTSLALPLGDYSCSFLFYVFIMVTIISLLNT